MSSQKRCDDPHPLGVRRTADLTGKRCDDPQPPHVRVAVDLPVTGTFTYTVPPHLADAATAGKRVWVPFGRRRRTGYILGPAAPEPVQTKDLLEVLDADPLFPPAMVALFEWVAAYYHHPLGQVIGSALPGGLRRRETERVEVTDAGRAALSSLTGWEARVLQVLQRRPRTARQMTRQMGRALPSDGLKQLTERGWVARHRLIVPPATGPKVERVVHRGPCREPLPPRAVRQRAVLAALEEAGPLSVGELNRRVPHASGVLATLGARAYVRLEVQRVERDPLGAAVIPDQPPRLTADQRRVLERIRTARTGGFATLLLAGVTGSGKTEIYLHLAAEVIAQRATVLVLVPEIALITQMERRFRARFGQRVAILHSGLSAGERFDQWQRITRGRAPIVIGVRSAVFAPLVDLGAIVVDEEHDPSYKQETGLRYNARDLAIVRGRQNGCPVLLGSATPSVQTYHNVQTGRFRELRLDRRIHDAPMPAIEIVDLRRERDQRGLRRFLSPPLLAGIERTLERGEQVLLFLNRRGFAGFAVCRGCGAPLRCRHCDIAMTFHREAGAYRCHYCGFSRPAATDCPSCGTGRLHHLGMGTEQLADAMARWFPAACVQRMDQDTTRRKGALVKLLKGLRERTIDVLVGTQMVAKGHDFPHITLVGIVCADLTLNFPDFRAGERTFQLLAQVAGRAGRGTAPGSVILQTYNPQHFAVLAAQQQDFRRFYDEEIHFRRALQYPPFSRLLMVRVSGRDRDRTIAAARAVGRACRELTAAAGAGLAGIHILGPVEAPLARIAGRHRWQVLIKCPTHRHLKDLVERLRECHAAVLDPGPCRVSLDVDPFSML